jgi:cytochrome c-type biogenesis protein
VAAPCTLPMLPIILGTSVGQKSRTRPLFIALGFVLSFVIVSIIFSVFAKVFGLSQNVIQYIGAALLLIFGIFMLVPYFFQRLSIFMAPLITKVSAAQGKASKGNLGGLFIGSTMGLIWAPCAGPVLAAILTLVATSKDLGSAAILLLFYAIGAALPMILIAYGGQYITVKVRGIAKYIKPIQQVFGVLIIALAILTFTGGILSVEAKAAGYFHLLSTPKY